MPTFGKSERLCNTLAIQQLFNQGRPIFKHPLKIIWLPAKWDNNHRLKVVISVSKRNFKKAVDRNRIKRLLRECFRLHKSIIEQKLEDRQCYIALIYTSKEFPTMNDIEPIIIKLFQRLIQEYESNHS